MAKRKLEIVLAGDEKGAVSAIDAVERKGDSLGSKMAGVGKVVGAAFLAVGAAALAGGALAVNAAMKVETGLREVNTLFGLSGAAAEASFKEMQAGVAGLSNEVGVAQDVLVGGLYQAISAGVPKENAFTFMEVAAKAAIAGVTDTETAVDGLTTIINAFGLEASDAQAVADSMFTAVKGGKTNFQELSDAMFNVAPAAAALGVDFTEVNAAIATLTASGTPTSVATTQLRAAMQGLTKPSADMTEIFKKLGFESAQVAIEEKGLGFALDAVRDAAKGDVGQLQKLLGSTEAVSAANVLAGTGAEKFAAELEAQGSAAGATNTAFEEMEQSVSRQFERIKVRIQNALISAGNALLPFVSKVMDAFSGIFDLVVNRDFTGAFAQAFNVAEDAPIVNTLFRIRDAVAGAIPVVLNFVRNVLGELADWWQRNSATIIRFAVVIASGIRTAFDGIVSGVQFVIRNWDRFKTVFAGVVAFLLPGFAVLGVQAMISATKQAAAWLMTQTATLRSAAVHSAHIAVMVAKFAFLGVQSLLHAGKVAAAWLIAMGPIGLVIAAVAGLVALVIVHWNTIKRVTLDLWNSVKAWTATAWESVKGVFVAGLNFVRAVWTTYWNAISSFYLGIWNGLRAIVSGAWNFIRGFISTGLQTLAGIWRGAWDGIRSFLSGAWSGMRTTVSNSISNVIGFFAGMPGRILGALGNIGGLLVGKGMELIDGFARGVRRVAGNVAAAVKDAIVGVVRKIPLIGGRAADWLAGALGDGPGLNNNYTGAPATGRGGNAMARARAAAAGLPVRMSSGYRTPEHNRRVGGSPRSHHLDRLNPASDWVGPTWALDELARRLRSAGPFRELLWRVPNHAPGDNPHVHYAHTGGVVSQAWPTMPGLAADERPAVLQVGETVVPRGGGMGNWTEVSRQASRMGEDMLEALIGGVQAGSRGLPSTFAGVGTDVTTGLAGGLRAGEPAVWSAMSMFSQGMPTKVKDQLGISSPSSVFHGYGHSVGTGYANGINAAIPQVTAAYAAMMRASGMVQAEDGSWVPRSFYSKRSAARAHHHHPPRTAPPNDDSFASNSYYSRNRGKPGAIQAEDGSWVMPSFYGRRAHTGGIVSPSWPTLEGLRGDERPAILQVGERVVPKDRAGGGDTHLHFHIGTFVGSDERALAELIARAKRKGYVGV